MCHFRLTTGEHGTAYADMFVHASKGSVYRKLFEGNMDNQSFLHTDTALGALQDDNHQKKTHFRSHQYILSFEMFNCKIVPVWLSPFPL